MSEVEDIREVSARRTALHRICGGLDSVEILLREILEEIEQEIEQNDAFNLGSNPVKCGMLRARLVDAERSVRWLDAAVSQTALKVSETLFPETKRAPFSFDAEHPTNKPAGLQ